MIILGVFKIIISPSDTSVFITSLGYETVRISFKNQDTSLHIKLHRKINELPEFLFVSQDAALNILKKAIEKIPDNYLPSSIPLSMNYDIWINKDDDTAFYAAKNVIWFWDKGKILEYKEYHNKEEKGVRIISQPDFPYKKYLNVSYTFPWGSLESELNDVRKVSKHSDITCNQIVENNDTFYVLHGIKAKEKSEYEFFQTFDITVVKRSLAITSVEFSNLNIDKTGIYQIG